MSKVLIVGGVAGGATAAARLRRLSEDMEIILFERGEYISFANCGLPYYIGGDITEKSALILQTPQSFHVRFRVDIRTQNEVTEIDRANKTVQVTNHATAQTYQESYDTLILSPGAMPVKPNIKGADNGKVFTLRNIPDTYRIKEYIETHQSKRAVIIGGGYIGVEMAENLHSAGLEVTLVEFADHVVAPLDFDMAADVHNHMRQKGLHLILNDGVQSIEETGSSLRLALSKQEITADIAIMAVGVRPESTLAQDAGLTVNAHGAIVTDTHMKTSDESIYAVGDAVEIVDFVTGEKGYIPLAGPANKQGRIAADNICSRNSSYSGTQGTGILKCFDLTIATTGITEKRAKELGLDYEKSHTYSASHASYYPGAVNMSVKIVYEKKGGRLLGAQIVGYDGADKRLDVLATAIRAGMTVYDLTNLELAYAPPFSSAKDPVNMAGYVAENILTGLTQVFHWDEVAALPQDGSVILLDIRTRIEYENGHIPGFINIPVDELREHLGELDSSKPVYVTCQVGLRGHVACRILTQHGFTCKNLSGGYRLWNSIFGQKPEPKKSSVQPNIPAAAAVTADTPVPAQTIVVNACGLQCPGPIMKLSEAVKQANDGDLISIRTTDPAFAADVQAWCRRTGNTFGGLTSQKGVSEAQVKKGGGNFRSLSAQNNHKNIIVFSGDLDKAIASFIIANSAAAMGRKVSMFFTFWGLNILRKPQKSQGKKDLLSRMFGSMMPRGSKKLKLSHMNMGGMGTKMIRHVMKNKNIDSLEDLITASIKNGVELIACSMSLDVMGLRMDELIDGVKAGGAAAMLANAEESDMSLFI